MSRKYGKINTERTIYKENDRYVCKKCTESASENCNRIWHKQDCKRWPQEITDFDGNVKGRWFLSHSGNKMAFTAE